jgi:hypothetical protein
MHNLTRKQRADKKKAKGKNEKKRSLNSHILQDERWVVTLPGTIQKPLAFHSEEKAMMIASAIAAESGMNAEVDHQTFNGIEWVS